MRNRFREWYRSEPGRPLILAHRGDSFRGPENTLEAGRLGLQVGADGWELDVHLTKDGVPVVIHDESLLRTTDVARRFEGDFRGNSGFLVGEFSLAEIRTLDAGSWFVEPSGGPRSAVAFGTLDRLDAEKLDRYGSGKVYIPTLVEALDLTEKFDKLVNVEIKPTTENPVSVVATILREIREAGATDRVAISSFDHDLVLAFARSEPRVATGILLAGPIEGSAGDLLKALGADAIHCPPSEAKLAKLGLPVLIYTVNDTGPCGMARRLIDERVSGIFTDDPESLVALLGIIPSSGRTRSR